MPRASRRFQSTLPGWGATRAWCDRRCAWRYFNPRSPDGERLRGRLLTFPTIQISIHAPRMGSDGAGPVICIGLSSISIHAPRMGSDRAQPRRGHDGRISIHAPRMGSDPPSRTPSRVPSHFNPRSPDGERRSLIPMSASSRKFQSTLPGWGATRDRGQRAVSQIISIHAPRMGSDCTLTGFA